jgi:FkbM family methyltransferase
MQLKSFLRSITPAPAWAAAGALKRRLAAAGRRSFSGHGEDLLVVGWFQHYGCDLSRIRYVDVGANHPVVLSNTFLLYQAGARGVLIEPDPTLAELLRARRPRDIVVNAGVAFDERRSATLFRMTSSVFNTFSRAQAEFIATSSQDWDPRGRQKVVGEITVPLIALNDIIAEHLGADAPHFLSVDAEGVDLAIVRTLDPALLNADAAVPALVCVEATASADRFLETLGPAGFEMAARTPDNWIFRRHRERLRSTAG